MPSNINKVLVTGGAGFVGKKVVLLLKEKGYAVRCLVRPESQAKTSELGIEIAVGNIWQSETLPAAFEGIDAVIHLVGIIQPHKDNTFEKVHTIGTANVVEQSKRVGVKKLVHMSALGTRENAISMYHKTKWAAEEIVRASGLNYTIFRPSIIFGEGSEFLKILKGLIENPPILRLPIVPILGLGANELQPIYVGDVAKFFVDALNNSQTDNKMFNLGGMRQFIFDLMIDVMCDILQKKRVKMHIPIYLLWFPAFIMEHTMSKPPFIRDQLLMLKENNICGLDEVLRVFKFELVDFEKWLTANLRSLQ